MPDHFLTQGFPGDPLLQDLCPFIKTKKDTSNEVSCLVAGEGVIPGILGNALPQLEAVQI